VDTAVAASEAEDLAEAAGVSEDLGEGVRAEAAQAEAGSDGERGAEWFPRNRSTSS
jgi:hypothetical protein